jgi:hypothetical protein
MQPVLTKLFDIVIIGHIHTVQQLSAQPSGAVLIVVVDGMDAADNNNMK